MIEKPVYDIYKDTELCKEFKANGWQTQEGFCLSQKNFQMLKNIYETTQEIQILNRRIFNSHQKSLKRREKGADFTVKDSLGNLFYINDRSDQGFFDFHHSRYGRDFFRPFDDGLIPQQIKVDGLKEENMEGGGDNVIKIEHNEGKKSVNNGSKDRNQVKESNCINKKEIEDEMDKIKEPIGHIPKPQNNKMNKVTNRRQTRIDNSSYSDLEDSYEDILTTPKKKQGRIIHDTNPFVKTQLEKVPKNKDVLYVADFNSIERISHDEEDEQESSTKKFLRLKQKMDDNFPIERIIDNEVMYKNTDIRQNEEIYCGNKEDIYPHNRRIRQKKIPRHKIQKKKVDLYTNQGAKVKSHNIRKLNFTKKSENLNEYRKLLIEAQKLLLSNIGNEGQGGNRKESSNIKKRSNMIQVEDETKEEGVYNKDNKITGVDIDNRMGLNGDMSKKNETKKGLGDKKEDQEKSKNQSQLKELEKYLEIEYEESKKPITGVNPSDGQFDKYNFPNMISLCKDSEDDDHFKNNLETLSHPIRKFVQQKVVYLNDKEVVIRYKRNGSFDFTNRKLNLVCSDPKCEGRAEIEINKKEEKEIKIIIKCTKKSNEHLYNYKNFFIRKIRAFDLGEEEFSYPQIQKLIFRELFVHHFELTEPQAILVFEKKFNIKPILSLVEIEKIKANFMSEIQMSSDKSRLGNSEGVKKKKITRSRGFWEEFEKLL